MSGLSFICDYGDSEESEQEDSTKLQKLKLPKPNLSKVLVVKSEDEYVDNPEEHGGRVRSFPHVRGNWATFVYITYPEPENLNTIINSLSNRLNASGVQCKNCENIHISLSKTFVLKYHLITPFTNLLQEELTNSDSFELGFNSVAIYCNEEKTRTFIALQVDIYCKRELTKLTEKINCILEDYKLPTFYKDPSFHMSILDVIGNKKDQVTNILEDLNHIFVAEEKNIGGVAIRKVECKSGNRAFQYYLK